MRVQAPGKVVLSGAYSVFEGADALVAAVDRYVLVDTEQEANMTTPEVAAAIECGMLPAGVWFDASSLRATASTVADRKLGLGASAAILVASLGANLLAHGIEEEDLPNEVFPLALRAHRLAQGGGSGIDVAASCFGGLRRYRPEPSSGALEQFEFDLPAGLQIEVYAASTSASTARMLAAVTRFRQSEPSHYRRKIQAAVEAAEHNARAQSARQFVDAFVRQAAALRALGQAAEIPVVTPEVAQLAQLAREHGAGFGPAGAGGGDLAVYIGEAAAPVSFRQRAQQLGHSYLEMGIAAPGVQRVRDN